MTAELLARLSDAEDQFTERKRDGASAAEFRRTLVAFANSVPPNRSAVLYVGVSNSGEIIGVRDPDKLQRTLRKIAETECYPPIYVDLQVLNTEKPVVAAVVTNSTKKPHFSGPAYVRRGSESVAATEQVYRELLLTQDDKRRYLLENQSLQWTVDLINKGPGESRSVSGRSGSSLHCMIVEVTAFYVRFQAVGNPQMFTEILEDIKISYDDKKHRPRAIVVAEGR